MSTNRHPLYTAIILAIATILGYLTINASLTPTPIATAQSTLPKSAGDPALTILQYAVDHRPSGWTCGQIYGTTGDHNVSCFTGAGHTAFGRAAVFSDPSQAYALWTSLRNNAQAQFPNFWLTYFNGYPGYHAEGPQPPYNFFTQQDYYAADVYLLGAIRTDDTNFHYAPDLAAEILNAAYALGYISTASPTPTPPITTTPTSTRTDTPLPSPTGCTVQPLIIENFETGSLGVFTSSVDPTTAPGWSPVTNYAHTGAYSAFAPDLDDYARQRLTFTQDLSIPANISQATFSFWHRYSFEQEYDCGWLYISTDNGFNWINASPYFLMGGYNIMCNDDAFPQPGWGNSTQGFFYPVHVDLTAFAGNNILVRFEERTDGSIGGAGWWVDDVELDVQFYCSTTTVTPTSTPNLTSTSTPTPITTSPATSTPNPPTASPTSSVEPELEILRFIQASPPTGWTCSDPGGTPGHRGMGCYTSAGHSAYGTIDNYGDPSSAQANWQTRRENARASYAVFQDTSFNGYPGYHAEGLRPPYNFFTQEDFYWADVRVLGATRVDDTQFHYAPDLANAIMNAAQTLGYLPTPTPTPTSDTTITPTSTTPTITSTPDPSTTPVACPIQFTDVPEGSTFYTYIRCLACRGIISGYSDNTFRPQLNVTRGQISKIVSNAAGFDDFPPAQLFEDVPPDSTFYTFIQRLASREYMSAYPCGQAPTEPCIAPSNLPYFRPSFNATRAQISKIVSNAAGFNDPPGAQQFEDVLPNSTFYNFIYRLASRSVMQGYPCGGDGEPCGNPALPYFRPNSYTTRGQTAKIVANTFFPNCQTP